MVWNWGSYCTQTASHNQIWKTKHSHLYNESDVAIDILFDVHVVSKKFDDFPRHCIRAGGKTAILLYDPSDQDDDDADFEITLSIKKLWKQVKEDGVTSNRSNNSQSVVQGQESLGEAVGNLVDKVGEGANPAEKFAEQDGIGVIDRANA